MSRINYYIIGILTALCISFCWSCAEVDLCEVEEHPHRATLTFHFDWEEDSEDKPEQMLIIANRIINTWRAGFVVELPDGDGMVTEGETVFGKLITMVDEEKNEVPPSEDETGEDLHNIYEQPIEEDSDENGVGETESEDITDESPADEEDETSSEMRRMTVKGGEYQFLAINHNYEESEIERLEEFRSDIGITARELYVKYKTNPKDSVDVGSRAWIDYNAYGFFIQSAMKPTYYAFVPKKQILSGVESDVFLSPRPITQEYTIRFRIEKEIGVKIDTIIGVLSGIPERFELTTQFVDVSHTHKMVFFPEADYDENEDKTLLECEGRVNAIGLLRANNSGYNQGPGILQLCVYTTGVRDGVSVKKTIYAIINLYNTIGKARPLVTASDEVHVQQNGYEIVLDISSILHIKNNEVWEDSDQDNALDVWQKARNFEIDI